MLNMCLTYKISIVSGQVDVNADDGHFDSYYLTGIMSVFNYLEDQTGFIGCTDIKYHVPWIREILNKHVSKYISLYV